MAPRPIRHAAAASRQAGRNHRREEDPDHHHTADIMPAPEPYPAPVRRAGPTTPDMTQTSRPAHPEKPQMTPPSAVKTRTPITLAFAMARSRKTEAFRK